MKKILLGILLLPACLHAQDVDTTRSAIGMYGERNTFSNSPNYPATNTVGIMYKKRKKENVNYSFTLGYCKSTFEQPIGVKVITGNTSTVRSLQNDINIVVAGFGVERQRHFYRKSYFFAGIDWKAGYGTGTTTSVMTRETWMPPSSPATSPYGEVLVSETSAPSPDISMFLVYVSPYIGAKLEFKKVTVGLMVMNYLRAEMHNSGGAQDVSFDFNAANLSKRLFVTYKL